MSDVDIVIQVATAGVQNVIGLSNAMLQLNRAVSGAVNPMRNLDARARALSQAIGSTDGSLKNHAKSVGELTRNNTILSSELNRTKAVLKGLGTEYKFATGTSNEFKTAAIKDLKAYEQALKGVRVRALTEDLKSLSQEQKRLGKDAQFVGRSLIIGLTTPIMLFGRYGLQALVGVDREFIRLNKVLESVAPNLDAAAKKMGVDLSQATAQQNKQLQSMVDNYEKLDRKLTATSTKFGLSKNITVGLAGEFAELGIQSTDAIAKITELTAATEKIGNMDIGSSKDLVQALYFQAQRALQQSGEGSKMSFLERENRAIEAATAQLRLFNSVENVTALTLRDLGDAFPEVAAAATSFGLSMTEAGALLAPMKAAGFEVGASANSIKVSLQRIVAPTKQNSEMLKALEKQYNVSFTGIKGTGLDAIQLLVDGFNELKKSTAGQEGAMEFFAKLFGVRQGPRMEVAIAQMAEFDAILKSDVIPSTTSAEKKLQEFANTAIAAGNKSAGTNIPLVRSFKDIGIIARIASSNIAEGQKKTIEGFGVVGRKEVLEARKVRDALSEEILKAQREGGEDLIGQVSSEAGRAMFVQLAGGANAAEVAQRELKASLGSLDVQISILRNNFKMFAADLIVKMKPAIEKISEVSTRLYNAWKELTPQTRKLITTLVLGFAAVTAAIGPLIFVFGQFRLAVGSIGKVIFGFLPGLKTMTVEMLASRSAMLNLKNPLTSIGDTVYNTNGKFATFIATIASGDGPLANFAKKIGKTTGVLKESTTAQMSVTRSLLRYNREQTAAVAGAVPGVGTISRTPIEPLRRLKRTAGGIVDALDPTARVSRAARKAFAEEEFSMEQAGLRRGGATGSRFNIREQSGLFRNRTVGFRSISAEDVGSAINLRQQAFEDSGITRTSPAGSLGGGILKRRGREISEEKALTIARGGVKGRIVESLDNIGAGASAARSAVTGAITGAPAAATAKYRAALDGAKNAQKALRIETLAFTGEGPTQFARMRAGVAGFAKSFGLVNNAIKLTKLTLIASGIGVIILSVGVAVMLVMKNMDKFKQAGASGLKVVKESFDIVKNAAMEIIRPIMDLFGSFGDGSQGAEGAVSGIGNAFNALAGVLKFVANMFSWLVKTIIQPYMYVIVNIVKFVISLFTGKWMDALKSLGAAFGGAFALIGKIILNIMAFIVKQVINLIFELPSAFMKAWAWGVERATDLFFGFVEFIIGQVKRIPVLGRFLGAAGNASLSVLKTARNAYVGTIKTVAGAVNTAGDFLKRGIDKGVQNATNAMDKLGKGGVKQSKGKISIGGKGKGDTAEVDAEPLQEEIANATGEGLAEGADEGGKALANKMKGYLSDLKKEVQSDIADRIKTTIDNVVTALKEGLKSQKEASLKIYDDQLKKIDETAKAEEKLTKTKEYENKKRELEEQRALNRLNNQRNYNLAVYEGRIDDARQIAMDGQKNEQDDSDKIKDLETSRSKELADQRREDLISSIKDARESSSKYFDEMIETFTNAAKKITEFPPTTAEKFNEQLELLKTAANTGANAIGTSFEEGFTGVLGNLGVNATGPLTSALQTITDTIVANNPFGETGVWQKTIDASLDGLKAKYEGMTDTLNMVIDENSSKFKALFEVYKSYKLLVDTEAAGGAGVAGGSITGASGSGKGKPTGGSTGGGTKNEEIDLGKVLKYKDEYLDKKYGGDAITRQILGSITGTVGTVVSSGLLLGSYSSGEKDFAGSINASRYKNAIRTDARAIYDNVMKNKTFFLKGSTGLPYGKNLSSIPAFEIGGIMPYSQGGATTGPVQQGIPAILHGGEYVVRNSAVKKYGWGMMDQINRGAYKPKPFANGGRISLGNKIKEEPFYDTTDPSYKEWQWQQQSGGLNYDFLYAIAKKESAKKKLTKGLPNWADIGGMRKSPDEKNPQDKSSGGFNMPISLWNSLGGDAFAKTPGLASVLQQMVINNRHLIFGWQNPKTKTYNTPRGTDAHTMPRYARGKAKTSYVTNPEFFDPSKSYNENLVTNENRKEKQQPNDLAMGFATPEGKKDFLKYWDRAQNVEGTQRIARVQNPFSKPVWIRPRTGKIENSALRVSNAKIVPTPKGFKIGGLVAGGAGKTISDPKKKKQSGFWNVMDKIQGGVNSSMNFAAGFLDYSGKQIKAMTYDPLMRVQEAAFNPLMQILRVPGSKNLKVATPAEAAYSGFEMGLTAFGGPATEGLISKLATIGIKGGMGPIDRMVATTLGKTTSMTSGFGINEAFAGTRDAKIAAIAKSKAMENKIRFNVDKSRLARISANFRDTGFADEWLAPPKGGFRRPKLGGGRQGYNAMQPVIDEIVSIRNAVQENVRISQAARAASKYNTILPRDYYNTRSFQGVPSRGMSIDFAEMEEFGVNATLDQFPRDVRHQILRPRTPRQFNETYDFFTPFAKARDAAKLAAEQKKQLAKTAEGLSRRELAKISAFSKPAMADIPLSLRKDKLIITLDAQNPFDFFDIDAYRPIESYKGFGFDAVKNTASIQGYVDQIKAGPLQFEKVLKISGMGASDDVTGQMDAIKVIFAMYEKFIKPLGINYIDPGSLSPYSANLVTKLQELIGGVNPDLRFIDGYTGKLFNVSVSNNTPRAYGGGFLSNDKPVIGDIKDIIDEILEDKIDIYKDLSDRVQIKNLIRQAIKNRNANKFNGGMMPYSQGGPTYGPVQQGIPAMLHGGEYVVRNSAVKKYGWGMLQNINQGTYNPKPFENGGIIPEYKIGGAVKGGAGKKKKKTEKEKNQEAWDRSQLNPFSDLNYKPINNPKSLLNRPRSTSKDFTLSTYGISELGRNTLQSLKSNYDYMKENGIVYENLLPKNLKNVNRLVNKVLTDFSNMIDVPFKIIDTTTDNYSFTPQGDYRDPVARGVESFARKDTWAKVLRIKSAWSNSPFGAFYSSGGGREDSINFSTADLNLYDKVMKAEKYSPQTRLVRSVVNLVTKGLGKISSTIPSTAAAFSYDHRYLQQILFHELGHFIGLDHTFEDGGLGMIGLDRLHKVNTKTSPTMSYKFDPNTYGYAEGDISGLQSIMSGIPTVKKNWQGFDLEAGWRNGGLIPEYKIGGFVGGGTNNKPISWEDQYIAFMAQEEMKKKKQSIFGKIKSTVAKPFVGIKNFAKDQLMKNMYGAQTGSGMTGSAMLLDRATNPNIERVTPGISALNMQSVRGGLSAAKTMTEMGAPVSGSFFSLQDALNPNKNAKSRITSGAAAGLSLLGPTSIFASNYGYMGGAYKSLPKTGSFVDEGLSNLKNPEFLKAMDDRVRYNVEQSRLAREAAKNITGRPLGAGRRGYDAMQPTIDEIASIRNSMKVKNVQRNPSRYASLPMPAQGSSTYEDNKLSVLEWFLTKQDQYYSQYNNTITTLPDFGYQLEGLEFIRQVVKQNVQASRIARIKSKYNSAMGNSYSLGRLSNRGLMAGFVETEPLGITEALMPLDSRVRNRLMSPMTFKEFNQSYDFFTPFLEVKKAKEAAKIAELRREEIARTVRGNVGNSAYVRYIKRAKAAERIREAVVDNINISKEIRAIKQGTVANIIKYGKASGPQVNPAKLEKSKLMMPLNRVGNYVSIQTWRPNAERKAQGYDVLENTSSLTGSVGKISATGERIFKVGTMGAQDSMLGSTDVVRLMFAFYENVLKPGNINAIDPGSTSIYSTNLVQRLKELMPDIKFVDRYTGADWTVPYSPNGLGFGFGIDPIISRYVGQDYNEFMTNFLAGRTDVYKNIADRVQIESIMRQAIKNRNPNKFNGGLIPGFANGGAVPGFGSAGFPALLHGGEYVVNSKAVKNIGFAALEAMNNMRFNTPKSPSYAGPVQPQTSSTSNVNIYVDNFIGEKQWFESMMKDYNINVSPQNQKTAGLQNRTISTYNGINRGM